VDVESASQQIDMLISRRGRDKANAISEVWAASERRHREERQQKNLEAWRSFHAHMHRLHTDLAASHAQKAEALPEGAG